MIKKEYHLDYLLVPKACPRPRVTKTGHSFMPKEYVAWKKRFIQETAIGLYEHHKNFKPIDVPINIEIQFVFPRPQRLQHREVPSTRIPHASKPDIDNLIKSVLDGLVDAQIMTDDNLVTKITASKEYCERMDDGGYEYSHISVHIIEA
jgi:Holliday junction resolvase RusA-like endonuclease